MTLPERALVPGILYRADGYAMVAGVQHEW